MAVDMGELLGDLAAETADLRLILADLTEPGWRTPTPAASWTIGDQISHLAFFDDAAITSATDPDRFRAELAGPAESGQLSSDDIAARHRALVGTDLIAWFDGSRERLILTFGRLDPAQRVPWFGPSMSAASAVTARIMETWAHGQDVADALGLVREPTSRLAHIAHIGVRALPFSFVVNGLAPPTEPVRIELAWSGGAVWAWGPDDAANLVTGPALDFCLLVTQRRHRDDTAIQARGQVAEQWLGIAQAFAGPPGSGRRPGQHGR
ncbi:MAG TPA: TIGR03084 family metal-binding protein [Streptosporangiaceae bacterium]|nr:TIGR03084 family metal-binding protein [Streptosporangiaceae bacterium]